MASRYDPAALKSGVYVLTAPDAVVANIPGNDRLSVHTVLVLTLRVVDTSCCTLDWGGGEKASDKRRRQRLRKSTAAATLDSTIDEGTQEKLATTRSVSVCFCEVCCADLLICCC